MMKPSYNNSYQILRVGGEGWNAVRNKICHTWQAGFFFDSRLPNILTFYPLRFFYHSSRAEKNMLEEEIKPKIEDKWQGNGMKGYFIRGNATIIGTQSQKNWKSLSHPFIEFTLSSTVCLEWNPGIFFPLSKFQSYVPLYCVHCIFS